MAEKSWHLKIIQSIKALKFKIRTLAEIMESIKNTAYNRAVIIAASPEQIPICSLRPKFRPNSSDYIIACDGGLNYVESEEITPNLIIGDFDSYKQNNLHSYDLVKNSNESICSHNFNGNQISNSDSSGKQQKPLVIHAIPEKDDTDTMLAVKYAFELGIKNILLLNATGGRLDHTFAVIQCASWIAENGGICAIIGNDIEIYTVTSLNSPFIIDKSFWEAPVMLPPSTPTTSLPSSALQQEKMTKRIVSVFALTQNATGVTEKGLKYALNNAVINSSFPIGISNEFLPSDGGSNQTAEISVKTGTLAVMIVKGAI